MISDINHFIHSDDDYEYNKLLMNNFKKLMNGGTNKEVIDKNKVTDILNGSEKYENIKKKNLLFYLCYLINPYTKSIFRSEINNYYNDNLNLISYSNIINKDIFSIKTILNNDFYEEMIDVINLIDKQEPENQNIEYLYLTDNEYLNSDENKYFCKDENCSPYPTLDNINDGRIFCNEGYYDEYKNGNCVCVKHFDKIIDTVSKIVSKEGRSYIGTLNATVFPDEELDIVVDHILNIKKKELGRELTDDEISSIIKSIKSPSKNDVIKEFIAGLKIDNKDMKNVKKVKKMMGGMKYKYNAKDIFNMDMNATKEINQIYTRLSKLSQYDICNMKKNNFISYLLDDVLKVDKSEQKGGFRYKLDDHIPLTEYNSIDKKTSGFDEKKKDYDKMTAEFGYIDRDFLNFETNIKTINNNSIEYLLEKNYDFNLNYNSKVDIKNSITLQKANKKWSQYFKTKLFGNDKNNDNEYKFFDKYKDTEKQYLYFFLSNNDLNDLKNVYDVDESFFNNIWNIMIKKKKGLFSLGYKGIYKILDFLIIFRLNINNNKYELIGKKSFENVDEKKKHLTNFLIKCVDENRYSNTYRVIYDENENNLIQNYMNEFIEYFKLIFINPIVEKLLEDNKTDKFPDNIIETINGFLNNFQSGDIIDEYLDKEKYNLVINSIIEILKWNIDVIGITKNEKIYCEFYKSQVEKFNDPDFIVQFGKNKDYFQYIFEFLYELSLIYKDHDYQLCLYKILKIQNVWRANEYYCMFNDNDSLIDSKKIFTKINELTGNFSIVKILNKYKNSKETIDTVTVIEDDYGSKRSEKSAHFLIPFSLIFRKGSTVKIKNDNNVPLELYSIVKIFRDENDELIFNLKKKNGSDEISEKYWYDIIIQREDFIEDKNNNDIYKYNQDENEIVAYYDYKEYRWDVINIEYNKDKEKSVDSIDITGSDRRIDKSKINEYISTEKHDSSELVGKSLYYKDDNHNDYIIEDIAKNPELIITNISSVLILDNNNDINDNNNEKNKKVSKINELLNFVLEGQDNNYPGLKLNIILALNFYNIFNSLQHSKETETITGIEELDITLKNNDDDVDDDANDDDDNKFNKFNKFFKNNFILDYIKITKTITKTIKITETITKTNNKSLFDIKNNIKTFNYYTDNYLCFNYINYNFNNDFKLIKTLFENIFKFNSYKLLYTFLEKNEALFNGIDDNKLTEINEIITANINYNNCREILKVISYYNNKFKKPTFKIRFYIIDNKLYTLYDLATIRDTFQGKFIYNEQIINTLSLYHKENKNEYDEDDEHSKCLGFSLLDIACEFGNFELAFHLVDKYNFKYNKKDNCGVTPAMRAFASIDNNKMDDNFSIEYFIKFFEKIEEKIRTEYKDNNEKIMEEISKLYNWKIPYFVIFDNSFISSFNNIIEGKNTRDSALTPSYFKIPLKTVFKAIAIVGLGVGAYFAAGFIPIGYIAGNYFGYVVSESIATYFFIATTAVVGGQGLVESTYYIFDLDKFLESKYNLSSDIELDYQMLYYKYNKYNEYLKNKDLYTENTINLYNTLKQHNNELQERINNNKFLKSNDIKLINNIDIATIYYKYYDFINSNPLYFLTKFRNSQLFKFYLSKISPSNDKPPSKNLLFYKIDHIDNLILSQSITSVYKRLQPNFLITIINAVFTKLYLHLKNQASINMGTVAAHTFVSFMSALTGPFIAFIIHLIIEAFGCYMKYYSNGITPSVFTIITDSVLSIFKSLGHTVSSLYNILQGALTLFNIQSISTLISIIVTICKITFQWFTGELNANKEKFNKLLKQLESIVIKNDNNEVDNSKTKSIDIDVNGTPEKITITDEDESINKNIKEQLNDEFRKKDKETAFNINLSEFAGDYYNNVKHVISMFFIDKITITKEYENYGSSILKKLDDDYIKEIEKKLKLYRGDKGDGFNEIPITECYNTELVTPYVINYIKVYEKLNEKKLSEYIGFSNNEKEKEIMITNDIQKYYTEINGYINTFEHYKTYLVRNTYYELLIIENKLNKKFIFFSIKKRINSLITSNNLQELEILLKSSDITEYLLSGDNSFLAFGNTIKGYTPMHYIITYNKLNFLTLIFDNVTPIEKATLLFARTLTKQSLFHIAVRLDDSSILEYLLKKAWDLSSTTPEDTLTEYKSKILLVNELNLTKVQNEKNFFKLIFNLEDKFKLNFYDNASEKYRLIINTYYTKATGENNLDSLLRVNRLGLVARKIENNKIVNRGTIIRVNYNDVIYQAEYINYDKDDKKVNIELLTKSDKKIRVTSILDKYIIEPIKIEDSLLNMYVGKTVTKELKIKITEKPIIKQNNFVGELNKFDADSKQLIKFCNSNSPDSNNCNQAFDNIKKYADDINSINTEILDILKNMFNRETVEYKIKVYNAANKFNISEFDIKNNIDEYNKKDKK